MSEMNKPMAAAMRAMADTATLPSERLSYLKRALALTPEDAELAQQVQTLSKIAQSEVRYVAIERAVYLGKNGPRIEGNIYRVGPNGSLDPLSGPELIEFNKQYPQFVRNWTLEDD
jgi:hypothetical protein